VAVAAVVFDLDGVLIDSEPVWEAVRREFVAAHGGRWRPDTQQRLMGMSTREWASYLRDELGVRMPADTVGTEVIRAVGERYEDRLPLMDGGVDAVRRLAAVWPLGLASSSPRPLVEVVLQRSGLASQFTVVLSTEEVPRGKPAPDVYLEVARRLGAEPARCVAVEDSTNGMRAALAAGLRLIAIPHPQYPPDPAVLSAAHAVLTDLHTLTPETVHQLSG
jgi:HAD superfamily hydrolase (TIGR01509 family)